MAQFLTRLKQRNLIQWAIAYVAFAFALLQGVDVIVQRLHWPEAIERYLILALALGLCVLLLLAWYHGQRGAQHVGGAELLILALLLAIGGALIWRFGATEDRGTAPVIAAGSQDGAKRYPGHAAQASATTAARTGLRSTQPIPAKSIAVLPFENLSADKENQYFVAGMQDLILAKLADIGELKVISRTSTAKYASRPDDLKTLGRQLGAATILEGSVQRQGKQVLITVQLIDTRTDGHLWAHSYTRTLDNVFGVEGEVAARIAATLKATLSPDETAHLATSLSHDSDAANLFLRAEYQRTLGETALDPANWKIAIPLYRQAVKRDPAFALAFARLSLTQSILAWFGGGGMDVRQLIADSRVNAERALRLAPGLAEAHLAMGYNDFFGHGDYGAARTAFAAALALRPNDAAALAAGGYILRRQGHFDAAMASLQQAFTLDPRNPIRADDIGVTYMMLVRYADAQRWLQRALALDPHTLPSKIELANAIVCASGDIPRALAPVQGDDAWLKLQRVLLLTYQRKYQEALALLDSVPDTPDNFRVADVPKAVQQAELYQLLGDMATARPLYARALPEIRAGLDAVQGINRASRWQYLAMAELGIGHAERGLDAIAKSQAVVDRTGDHMFGPAIMKANAQTYAAARRPDLAVPLLAKALATPGIGWTYSPVLLWLDPAWDPIRHDAGFQGLLKKYARYKPAVTYPIPPASAVAAAPASP
ncbi:MAG TPA: hypothetical protein VFX04_10685 [Rhodanobacteraceae bacterium]|jgi:TolB-like protein/cytochrome c-type biogenesis protein CcmH/NrfG|nr:hypothetical protein [Rhodanobacteraceae bacterium]